MNVFKQWIIKSNPEKVKKFCRKTSTLTLFFSSIIVVVSSLVLYVGPPTHVANFSDSRAAGLGKCPWSAVHIMVGLLFVVAMFFHIYFNWKSMLAYMSNSKRNPMPLSKPLVVSLVLTAYVCMAALLGFRR